MVGGVCHGGRQRGESGEVTDPQCSPHSMVSLEWGAPLLLFPTAAQLCPLQLLLQLGNLGAQREGEGRQVRQSRSALGPAPSTGSRPQQWLLPEAHENASKGDGSSSSISSHLRGVQNSDDGFIGQAGSLVNWIT